MYTEKDLIRIAKRENNQKRNYLLVNPLQGKHIPVHPGEALCLFRRLADSFLDEYKEERLLIIGFAETATAIGAAVAVRAGAAYIQTTREEVPDAEYLYFSEEHSHATEQKLVRSEVSRVTGQTDRIIFVEDELTTGKTIQNIIRVLRQTYGGRIKFSVASLLNGMDAQARRTYEEQGIRLHYLVWASHEGYGALADRCVPDGFIVPCNTQPVPEPVEELVIKGGVNARRLTDGAAYEQACVRLWEEIYRNLYGQLAESAKVLVLGTEEFMYPALYVAAQTAQLGADTVCHATTRSPVVVSGKADYPLHVRYELRSLYDRERVTYVYDLSACDLALIVTDARGGSAPGEHSLIRALKQTSQRIVLVRWLADD